jgi:hypothetical protein
MSADDEVPLDADEEVSGLLSLNQIQPLLNDTNRTDYSLNGNDPHTRIVFVYE